MPTPESSHQFQHLPLTIYGTKHPVNYPQSFGTERRHTHPEQRTLLNLSPHLRQSWTSFQMPYKLLRTTRFPLTRPRNHPYRNASRHSGDATQGELIPSELRSAARNKTRLTKSNKNFACDNYRSAEIKAMQQHKNLKGAKTAA